MLCHILRIGSALASSFYLAKWQWVHFFEINEFILLLPITNSSCFPGTLLCIILEGKYDVSFVVKRVQTTIFFSVDKSLSWFPFNPIFNTFIGSMDCLQYPRKLSETFNVKKIISWV